MENIEIEYKVMISKQDFNRLIKAYPNAELMEQINHYFETPNNDCKKNNIALRIRTVNNKNIITLKERLIEGKLEHEFYCDGTSKEYLNDEIKALLDKHHVDYDELIEIGILTTYRHEFKIDDNVICFDESHYNGVIDYEVECESDSMKHAQKMIKSILKPLGIKYKKSKHSKLGRFKRSMAH